MDFFLYAFSCIFRESVYKSTAANEVKWGLLYIFFIIRIMYSKNIKASFLIHFFLCLTSEIWLIILREKAALYANSGQDTAWWPINFSN